MKSGRLRPGNTVLTLGSGGVCLFALQFARMCGARVIATSSSHAKLERLRELGADAVVDYEATPDWGRRVRELNGGRGVDLVVEVGGRRDAEGVACGSIEDLRAVIDAVSLHRIEPVVDRVFPFDAAREAFSYLASGRHFGKVVISIDDR